MSQCSLVRSRTVGMLALPVPGANLLPSLFIAAMSLAFLEEDGLCVLVTLTCLGLVTGLGILLSAYLWTLAG